MATVTATAPRTKRGIEIELKSKRAAYHVAFTEQKETREQLKGRDAEIRALMAELSALLSQGAKPCPGCKEKPHGMHKRQGVYEVGCIGPCKGRFAQADSVAEAVEKWNADEYSTRNS